MFWEGRGVMANLNFYAITYRTKLGRSVIITTYDFDAVKKKTLSLFKQKLRATIHRDGVVIGKVFKDETQRVGFNWELNHE